MMDKSQPFSYPPKARRDQTFEDIVARHVSFGLRMGSQFIPSKFQIIDKFPEPKYVLPYSLTDLQCSMLALAMQSPMKGQPKVKTSSYERTSSKRKRCGSRRNKWQRKYYPATRNNRSCNPIGFFCSDMKQEMDNRYRILGDGTWETGFRVKASHEKRYTDIKAVFFEAGKA